MNTRPRAHSLTLLCGSLSTAGALLIGCAGKPVAPLDDRAGAGEACVATPDCLSGLVCLERQCYAVCNTSSDCSTLTQRCDERGVCVEVLAPDCARDDQCTDQIPCRLIEQARCLEGRCRYPLAASGSPCSDPNLCVLDEECNTDGNCVGSERVCDQPPGQDECINDDSTFRDWSELGTCTPASGTCVYTSNEVPCLNCRLNCLQVCRGVSCPPPNDCLDHGRCDPATVTCEYDELADGTPCRREGESDRARGHCQGGACATCAGVDHVPCYLPGQLDVARGWCLSGACVECLTPADCLFPPGLADCFTDIQCPDNTCVYSLTGVGPGSPCCAWDAECAQFNVPPACTEPDTCQGMRTDFFCGPTNSCLPVPIDDDSGCSDTLLVDGCSDFADLYCDGRTEQPVARCPTSCADDLGQPDHARCDAGFNCLDDGTDLGCRVQPGAGTACETGVNPCNAAAGLHCGDQDQTPPVPICCAIGQRCCVADSDCPHCEKCSPSYTCVPQSNEDRKGDCAAINDCDSLTWGWQDRFCCQAAPDPARDGLCKDSGTCWSQAEICTQRGACLNFCQSAGCVNAAACQAGTPWSLWDSVAEICHTSLKRGCGTCRRCDADGDCAAVAAGTDPDSACSTVNCGLYVYGWDADTSGRCMLAAADTTRNGYCDGAGACYDYTGICINKGSSESNHCDSYRCRKASACPYQGLEEENDDLSELCYTDNARHDCLACKACNASGNCTNRSTDWGAAADLGCSGDNKACDSGTCVTCPTSVTNATQVYDGGTYTFRWAWKTGRESTTSKANCWVYHASRRDCNWVCGGMGLGCEAESTRWNDTTSCGVCKAFFPSETSCIESAWVDAPLYYQVLGSSCRYREPAASNAQCDYGAGLGASHFCSCRP